jgi:integrase
MLQAKGSLKVNGVITQIRESLHTSDPDEAHRKCLQLEMDILLGKKIVGRKVSATQVLFSDLIKRFLADPTTGSGKTVHQILEKLDDHYGSTLVSDFTKADATHYIYENHTSKGHGNNHTRRVITQIQSLLNYAHEQGFRNERITLRKPPEDIKDLEVLSPSEIDAVFKRLKPCNRRLASFILYTGARPAEAYTLRRKDVDFPRKTCVLTSIKGRNRVPRKRTIPLNAKAYAAAHGNQLAELDKGSDLMFTYMVDKEHRPYHTVGGYSYFINDWSEACTRAKVVGKSPYTLRHTFGSRLGDNNTPFAVISQLMGHTDPKTTMRYVHPTFEDHLTAVTSIL